MTFILKKIDKRLLSILILGLILRLIGLDHAFPFIFHPDEPTVVRSALGIRFNPNPGHFDWPHLYIYINYFVYMVFAKLRTLIELVGLKEYLFFTVPIIWNDNLIFYLLTRILSSTLGAFTIIPIYLIGRDLFGKKEGLIAALAISITPFHVWHSHYSLIDVPMMFFLSWGIYFSAKIMYKDNIINYLLAGLFVGLAASTKYNGAFGVLGIVLAHYFRIYSEKTQRIFSYQAFETLILGAFATVFGFLIGTPYAIYDYETFTITENAKGALWQFTNVGDVSFYDQVSNFLRGILVEMPENFGYTIFYVFLVGGIFYFFNSLRKKSLKPNKSYLYFFLLGIFLIFYVYGLEKSRAHYFFIAYPYVIVLFSVFAFLLEQKVSVRFKKYFWILVFIIPFANSLLGSITFANKDTRIQLYEWLLANSRQYNKILYTDSDLKPVMEVIDKDSDKVESYVAKTPGTLFITGENNSNLRLLQKYDNNYRKGPNIYIYD